MPAGSDPSRGKPSGTDTALAWQMLHGMDGPLETYLPLQNSGRR